MCVGESTEGCNHLACNAHYYQLRWILLLCRNELTDWR